MVSQAGKEPRNLADYLVLDICCFSPPSVLSWEETPAPYHVFWEAVNQNVLPAIGMVS